VGGFARTKTYPQILLKSRIFRSAGTSDRIAAQEFHDKLKVEYWRLQKLGYRHSYTWSQAVVQ
ncbi:MAG: hypothetical protein RRB22_13195, partial [Gammaproteobacteria bacterium]|nr:hypothetical protein [Gammaproteobacteria bacterium]